MERNERIAVLDGLRAWAIILVVFYHSFAHFIGCIECLPSFPKGFFNIEHIATNGWIGVDLFFVLSGYLISTQLFGRYYDNNKNRISIKPFLKQRLLRIVPLYLFILTLLASGRVPGFPFANGVENIEFRYIYHFVFMQDYLSADILPVMWSLAVEVKFYLLAPFLAFGLLQIRSQDLRCGVVAALLVLLPMLRYAYADHHPEIDTLIAFDTAIRRPFHFATDGLFAGMMCALIVQYEPVWQFIKKPAVSSTLFTLGAGTILAFIFSAYHFYDGISMIEKALMPTILAFGFAAMLLSLLSGCFAAPFFAWKGFKPIALISYSAYLTHSIVIPYVGGYLERQITDFSVLPTALQYAIFIPAVFVPTGVISFLTWRFIERPFMNLGNRSHQKDRRQTEERQKSNHVGDGR